MATNSRSGSSVAVLLVLIAVWAGISAPGAHGLNVENCLKEKLQVADLHCEVNGYVHELTGLLPGDYVDLHLSGLKIPLSLLTIKLKTDPHKVYKANHLDLLHLPLSGKLKIGPGFCGYKNQGLSAEVYTNFFGIFTFKLKICLPLIKTKHY